MKRSTAQNLIIKVAWVAVMLVITYLIVQRWRGEGVAGYVSLGIVAVMWTIFLLSFSGLNSLKLFRQLELRGGKILVVALIVLAEAALVIHLLTCVRGRDVIGGLVTLLFIVVLVEALKHILTHQRKTNKIPPKSG